MSEKKEFFKVLWVENDPIVTRPLPRRAEKFRLDLRPFPCWDDAQVELEKDFDSWDAIILDAKCKHHRDSLDNAAEFLREALMEIRAICREKGRQLNWYILTGEGGAETESINEHIPEERMKWDADWTEQTGKKFYSKKTDEIETLFMRVAEQAMQSERTQIQTILYKDVFDALGKMKGFDVNSATRILADILTALHFNMSGFKPVLYYNQLRQFVEHLFRACNKVGLIPDQCLHKGEVNLSQSSLYLAGKDALVAGVRYGDEKDRVVTPHIEREIRSVLELGNINSHTVELEDADQKLIEELFRTANSKYVIFSLALQMCDVVVWLEDYISKHDNRDENLKKCVILAKDDSEGKADDLLEEARKRYISKVFLPSKDEEGFWHCGECSVILSSSHSGAIVIDSVDVNTDRRTKLKYKYFAKYSKA